MSTAREGTESEPRRWTLIRFPGSGPWHVAPDPTPPHLLEDVESVEVVEVGSGHDEQTEDRAAEGFRAGWGEAVAAVVKFIRPTPLGGTPLNSEDFDRLNALARLADHIEERFKPSAPGGDTHG